MNDPIVCRTTADLIAALSALPPDTGVISHEPPFTGVQVVPQGEGRAILIASLWNTDEGRAERQSRKTAA